MPSSAAVRQRGKPDDGQADGQLRHRGSRRRRRHRVLHRTRPRTRGARPDRGGLGVWVEIAMMRTPDGHGRIELSRFLAPPVAADHRDAPVNALGYLRVMFAVEDLDDTLARLGKRGAAVVGEGVGYQDGYRLCYIRGPERILIGLAQQLGPQASRTNSVPQEQG